MFLALSLKNLWFPKTSIFLIIILGFYCKPFPVFFLFTLSSLIGSWIDRLISLSPLGLSAAVPPTLLWLGGAEGRGGNVCFHNVTNEDTGLKYIGPCDSVYYTKTMKVRLVTVIFSSSTLEELFLMQMPLVLLNL